MKKKNTQMLLILGAVVVGGGVAYYFYKKSKEPAVATAGYFGATAVQGRQYLTTEQVNARGYAAAGQQGY